MSSGPRSKPPDLPNFRHVGYLGGGGFADVFLYEQLRPARQVAIKVLRNAELDAAAQRNFDAEGDLMARVSTHPYIVTIFGVDVAPDGRPFLVMEYYSRPNLGSRVKQGVMPVPEVLQLGVRLASAVETAHRAGILHRDIKPANVLVSHYGRPGLTDFGIAGVDHEGSDESQGVTVPYSAAEVVGDKTPGDERSDVYSLAATLYALLAGRSPFEIPGGDNALHALAQRVLNAPLPAIGRADVPQSLELLLAQALSRDPLQRPRSAADLARALQGIERELGHSPTEFELADDSTGAFPLPASKPDDDDDGTRASRIQVVQQTPADPATAPRGAAGAAIRGVPSTFNPAPAGGHAPVLHLPVPDAPGAADTMARTGAGTSPPPVPPLSPPPPIDTPGRSQWPLVAAGIVLVAIVGVVLILAGREKVPDDDRKPTTTVPDPGGPGFTATSEAPLPTDIVVTVAGTTATVTWSAGEGAEDGDVYSVTLVEGGPSTTKEVTGLQAAFDLAADAKRACVEIETKRGQRRSALSTGRSCSA